MGAVTGIMGLDDRAAAWLERRGADLSSAALVELDRQGRNPDLEIDLGDVAVAVAAPSSPDATRTLKDMERSVPIDQLFISTCAGGRLEDLQAAAAVLRQRRVKPGIRLLVGPASTEVLTAAIHDGTLDTLLAAGTVLLPVGCGACMGRLGALGEGEGEGAVQNRNFVGRAGHPGPGFCRHRRTVRSDLLSGSVGESGMKVTGRVLRLPPPLWDDINTDIIIAGRYLRLPEEQLGRHAFEGVVDGFPALARGRSILVAGANMGCGSSREQAPKALIGCGVKLVLAQSFGFIFHRNAINLGLPVLAVPDDGLLQALAADSEITADLARGTIHGDGRRLAQTAPLEPNLLRILEAGGILPLLRDAPHSVT